MTEPGPGAAAGAPAPPPVADVDEQFRHDLGRVHRARWTLIAAIITLLVAAVIVGAFVIMRQQSELRASCGIWGAVAPLPAAAQPPAARPAKVSVVFIAASRDAYAGQGCGPLPPAAPSLLRWAAYYHVRVQR